MVGRRIRKERCRRLIDPCLRKSRKKDSFENCLRGCMSVRMGSCKRLLSVVYVKSRQCIPYPRSPPKKRHKRPSLRPRKTKQKTLKKLGISLPLSTSGLAKASQEKENKNIEETRYIAALSTSSLQGRSRKTPQQARNNPHRPTRKHRHLRSPRRHIPSSSFWKRGGGGDFDVPFLGFVIYLRERIRTALLKGFGYIALSLLSPPFPTYLSIRILFVILSSVCERSSYHQNEQRASHFIPSRLVSSYL